MTEPELPEHVARNRVYWDEVNAPLYAAPGARAWARQEITWGIFSIPDGAAVVTPFRQPTGLGHNFQLINAAAGDSFGRRLGGRRTCVSEEAPLVRRCEPSGSAMQ